MSTLTELGTLDVLEAEAVHIIRECAAECERPVLLFSGGKDSIVLAHLATKAFAPIKLADRGPPRLIPPIRSNNESAEKPAGKFVTAPAE